MAPNLSSSQHVLIRDMILEGSFRDAEVAEAASCSTRTVKTIRANLSRFGSTTAPYARLGRRARLTAPMVDALCEHLEEKPDLYLEEMVVFVCDEFGVLVAPSTISRALTSRRWSRKATRRVAQGRNADLRDSYLYDLTSFSSFHLVYIDESGCDRRIGFRRSGWSRLGVTPVQITHFHRGERYQILPAYHQDGVLSVEVFQGTTDATRFRDFVARLLPLCGRWPEPRSVLVMDNASFHRTPEIKEMCDAAGVKLLYLPPYSPDLNPIEEFFAELKAFIKKTWHRYEDDPDKTFYHFLEDCVYEVGSREESARGHFRHAGVIIEET